MHCARRAASDWGIVQDTSAWKIVTYFAATTRRKMTYGAGKRIPTWRTFSFGRKTKR
jgi:hypothetical protein